jgi:hypothetical protein
METWTGTQLGFAIRACYRNEKYFRESPGLFRHYFEIHHNDPVLLANAIKKWVKNYEETGSALATPPPPKKTFRLRVMNNMLQ